MKDQAEIAGEDEEGTEEVVEVVIVETEVDEEDHPTEADDK